jgi:hypothetical protein
MHLFEPTKKCFKTLSDKFKNNLNFKLNNFGASDNNNISTIYYDKEQS